MSQELARVVPATKSRAPARKKAKTSANMRHKKQPLQDPKKQRSADVSDDDSCPLCQMPFKILVVQTRNWHLTECMQVDRSQQKECKMSPDCDSTIVSHYLQTTHFRLADRRSGIMTTTSDTHTQPSSPVIHRTQSNGAKSNSDTTMDTSDDSSPLATSLVHRMSLDSEMADENETDHSMTPPANVAKKLWPAETSFGSRESLSSLPTNGFRSPTKTGSTLSDLGGNVAKKPGTNQLTISSLFGYPQLDRKLNVGRKAGSASSVSSQDSAHVDKSNRWSTRSTGSTTSSKFNRDWQSTSSLQAPPTVADDHGGSYATSTRRRCPQYKKLPDVPFTVDAFRYGEIPGVVTYFLSHFHYDHYDGLTSKFQGELYCSQVTANLVKLKLRVKDVCMRALPMDQPRVVHGVEVSLVDANHCPGSVMFVFRYANGQTVLHTGDFRADQHMLAHPSLNPLRVDYLYLDTTYCQPNYDFPTQKAVLDFVVDLARRQIASNPKTLFVCGSYTVGKEKVFTAIAHALKMRVFAKPDKRRILLCLDDEPLHRLLSTNDQECQIHVLRMSDLNFKSLQSYLCGFKPRYTHVMALKPTGWEFSSKNAGNTTSGNTTDLRKSCKFTCREDVTIYGIPYSEHSSFSELRDFVQAVKPGKIIPTVNVTGQRSQAQNDILSKWTTDRTNNALMPFRGTIDELLRKPKIEL